MRLIRFIPLIVGLLGFSAQQAFACTGALAAGCEYCRAHLSECGIPNPTALTNAKNDGITEGKALCVKDPKGNCDITISQDSNAVTDKGKDAGRQDCLNKLEDCKADGVKSGKEQLAEAKATVVCPIAATSSCPSDNADAGKKDCLDNLAGCTVNAFPYADGQSKSGAQQLETAKAEKVCPISNTMPATSTSCPDTESVKTACLKNLNTCSVKDTTVKSGQILIDEAQSSAKIGCKNDPTSCGIQQKQDPNAITDAGKNAGKVECLNNLAGCTVAGATAGQTLLNNARKEVLPTFDGTKHLLTLPSVDIGNSVSLPNVNLDMLDLYNFVTNQYHVQFSYMLNVVSPNVIIQKIGSTREQGKIYYTGSGDNITVIAAKENSGAPIFVNGSTDCSTQDVKGFDTVTADAEVSFIKATLSSGIDEGLIPATKLESKSITSNSNNHVSTCTLNKSSNKVRVIMVYFP